MAASRVRIDSDEYEVRGSDLWHRSLMWGTRTRFHLYASYPTPREAVTRLGAILDREAAAIVRAQGYLDARKQHLAVAQAALARMALTK